MNYLNEWSPFAAQWCRNLAEAGEIPACVVDETDIRLVTGDRLNEYNQCHFFAGIAGWPLALKLAGVPADFPVWTGSCPCQPFSVAGNKSGMADERHLWPAFFRLIKINQPPIVFGEQTPDAIRHGWLDAAFDDMQAIGYTGWADIMSADILGAYHNRERLFFAFANADGVRQSQSRFSPKNAFREYASCHREADRFVNAVRRYALPVLCGGHDGVSAPVGKSRIYQEMLTGYGNAIVPELAALFVTEFFGSIWDLAGEQS